MKNIVVMDYLQAIYQLGKIDCLVLPSSGLIFWTIKNVYSLCRPKEDVMYEKNHQRPSLCMSQPSPENYMTVDHQAKISPEETVSQEKKSKVHKKNNMI